jgi:hypothetical protein
MMDLTSYGAQTADELLVHLRGKPPEPYKKTPKGKFVALSNFERYERIAWVYDLFDLPYGRYRKIRPLLFWGLSGRILEAGVGTGRNFPFYPRGSEIVGIDFKPGHAGGFSSGGLSIPMVGTGTPLISIAVSRHGTGPCLLFSGRSNKARAADCR